jgi:hypothetical protein
LWLAGEVETLCKQYAAALQVGTPRVLGPEEIEKTIEKFKNYGPKRKPRAAQRLAQSEKPRPQWSAFCGRPRAKGDGGDDQVS